ncbi:MAG: alanine racemase [Omnitrophica WOR_2 bacterium RIFCSPLOWO2_12_FULL_46_30]|nr:MAG: alanine racemase [Omnitrophica WOR_2 bacterium RIFCSPHIGHO2_02_FULL_46_37]OGX52261.1 MAG: alanine racemase [Omnitrophica WOR_2 bacterium RIFCSPLOWO2_12_FULL_46_30]
MDPATYRPTWAEINLKNLAYNFRLVKKLAGRGVKILVPVKADGYGHGLVAISERLQGLGVDYLGVASLDEGILLRRSGLTVPILVLSTVLADNIKPLLDYNLTQTVCTKELASKLNHEAKKRNILARVHIKVDTGMHRIGVAHKKAYSFIKAITKMGNIKIEGVFTHFPCADNNPCFTEGQIRLFNALIRRLEKSGIDIPLKHASNSSGVINYPEGYFNLVRPGLMIYGLSPSEGKPPEGGLRPKLRPLLSLKTKIIYLKTVPKGSGISYGHTYVTPQAMRIATLPIGYGDGYPRSLSNKARCLISGREAKIVGRVCMDQLMVDVTKIKKVKIGQEAVLIGRQKNKSIKVEQLAELAGTIPYEIVCNLGGRIRRIYKN